MALSYTNLFGIVGEHVERVNEFRSIYTTLDTGESETEADYTTAARNDLLAAIPPAFLNFKTQVLSWISSVNSLATVALTDRNLVLKELPVGGSTDIQTILRALHSQMIVDVQTINASLVTIGAVTKVTANANAGTALTSKVLDGYNPPMSGASANVVYAGLNSELSYNDTVTLKCISDSEAGNGGTAVGSEVFQWVGLPVPTYGQFGWESTGSGTRGSIVVLNSFGYFANQDFETFTSNAPGSWTIDSGTAGTHIFQESSSHYRGSSALKFTGDGATATIKISQNPASGQRFQPRQRYALACHVKGEAGTAAGTLTIQFEGTGYTASSSEKIEMNAAALAAQTAWDRENFFINMPAEVPDDMEIVIKVTGTLTTAKSVWIDNLAFGPATYENGVNVVIHAGSAKFLAGDTLTFSITNNDAGVFQTWFRKAFLVQLASSGAPTISDSLAT